MDEGFIRRTYRTSAWVLLLVALFLSGLGKFRVAWSIAAGAALALGVLRGFEWMAQTWMAPERKSTARMVTAKFTALKLPVLALVLYLVVRSGWFDLAAFAGGVVLVQAVIFLKAVGQYLVQREEDRRKKSGEPPVRLSWHR